MREKIINSLLKADRWVTPALVADSVGSRSAGNMSVYLKALETDGVAVSRTRLELGITVVEYRHVDKPDVADNDGKRIRSPHKLSVAKTVTPEDELSAWRAMAQKHGVSSPHGMSTFIGIIQSKSA